MKGGVANPSPSPFPLSFPMWGFVGLKMLPWIFYGRSQKRQALPVRQETQVSCAASPRCFYIEQE